MKKLLVIFLPAVALVLFVFFVRSQWMLPKWHFLLAHLGASMSLQNFLTFLGTLTALYAAIFAYNSWKASRDTLDASYMPFLFIGDDEVPAVHASLVKNGVGASFEINVTNAGLGHALNVEIDPIKSGFYKKMIFSKRNVIVIHRDFVQGDGRRVGSFSLQDQSSEKSDFDLGLPSEIIIRCNDLAGNSYAFIYTVKKEGEKFRVRYSNYNKSRRQL